MNDDTVSVELSNGNKIEVRTLGIFELEEVPSNIPGPFTYEIVIAGEKHRAIYDHKNLKKPPKEPENKNPEEGTKEHSNLLQWNLYQASLAHEQEQRLERKKYYLDVVNYVLKNAISPSDINKIKNEEDWNKVHRVALVPRLTKDILAHTLKTTYQASYDNKEIFDAMSTLGGGLGMYDAISLWENKVMLQLRMTEIEYSTLSLAERSRKVCAYILDDMMAQLDSDRRRREDG